MSSRSKGGGGVTQRRECTDVIKKQEGGGGVTQRRRCTDIIKKGGG